jgi:hypothetical protein
VASEENPRRRVLDSRVRERGFLNANEVRVDPKTQVPESGTWGTLRVCGVNANAVLVLVVGSRTLHELREGMRHPRRERRELGGICAGLLVGDVRPSF